MQPKLIPAVTKLKDCYVLWQKYLQGIPKQNRYTLASRIDETFLTAIEFCFLASYAPLNTKLNYLERAISRVDLLKLLIQILWEIKAIDNNKYVELSEYLVEVGKMLGGWKKGLESKQNKNSRE